jgi:hypothetical protein
MIMNAPEEKMKARQSLMKVIVLVAPLALGILGGMLGGYLYHSVNDRLNIGNTPTVTDQPDQPPEHGADSGTDTTLPQ